MVNPHGAKTESYSCVMRRVALRKADPLQTNGSFAIEEGIPDTAKVSDFLSRSRGVV